MISIRAKAPKALLPSFTLLSSEKERKREREKERKREREKERKGKDVERERRKTLQKEKEPSEPSEPVAGAAAHLAGQRRRIAAAATASRSRTVPTGKHRARLAHRRGRSVTYRQSIEMLSNLDELTPAHDRAGPRRGRGIVDAADRCP
jgi:hypothetical protein